MTAIILKVKDTTSYVYELRKISKNLDKDLGAALWKAGKWATSQKNPDNILNLLTDVSNTPRKAIRKVIRMRRDSQLSVRLSIRSSAKSNKDLGISLKWFGPRQLKSGKSKKTRKKRGVQVKAFRKGGGKVVFLDGFMFGARGKSVYRRLGKGRGNWEQIRYPKTPETFIQFGLGKRTRLDLQRRLRKEIEDRTRFLLLKAQGKLRGKQPK